ncbi:MAG: tautomerase family protein [Actinomycetota bacterium]
MPVVRIEVLKGYSPSQDALTEALKIPDDDRLQRLVECDAEDFEIPPDKSEKFTLVDITMFPGRSLSAKRHLYKEIVGNLAKVGIPENDVFIVVHEPPIENWGIRGGSPASEVDLGFQVDV